MTVFFMPQELILHQRVAFKCYINPLGFSNTYKCGSAECYKCDRAPSPALLCNIGLTALSHLQVLDCTQRVQYNT